MHTYAADICVSETKAADPKSGGPRYTCLSQAAFFCAYRAAIADSGSGA